MTLAAVCYVLSVCAQDNKRIAPSTLSEGDLLFCVAESDNNITDVTTGLEGKRIDHVAIFHRKDGQGFALEAIHKGVCLSPIDSFMTRRQKVMVAQLKDTMGGGLFGGTGLAIHWNALRFQFHAIRQRHVLQRTGAKVL